jgi:Zn-dependent M28 family amino/carboxypeptidase
MSPHEVDEKITAFLVSAGSLAKVGNAELAHGQISAFVNRAYNTSKAVPSIVVQSEDYGRVSRLLADGIPVEMEIEIDNTIYADGQNSFNVIAEISGTDKKEQVVMMGAHIDSWHPGTGATDNAAGVAAVMEAARILQKLGVKPSRTIRVALWGGEEQGLLGSKAYIREHFGTFEEPKPEYSNLAAYINIDAGTGRVRGATVFGPPEAAAILDEILKSFSDLDVVGANFTNKRAYGGTDTTAFNRAGLPGINLRQDPIEYYTHSWHTDLDTYERVLEKDLRQCVIVIASVVYNLAMRDEMLPRLTGDAMPSPE